MTTSKGKQQRVRLLTNVRDLETGVLWRVGEEVELALEKARRWEVLGLAVFVEEQEPVVEPAQKQDPVEVEDG